MQTFCIFSDEDGYLCSVPYNGSSGVAQSVLARPFVIVSQKKVVLGTEGSL